MVRYCFKDRIGQGLGWNRWYPICLTDKYCLVFLCDEIMNMKKMNAVLKTYIYSFIKSQVTYRTCYNQSTGYTKYGPARRLATQ